MEFRNINELYERILPALNTRVNELKIMNINTDEKEIWNTLINLKWKQSKNLSLDEMVNDILNFNGMYGDINERK